MGIARVGRIRNRRVGNGIARGTPSRGPTLEPDLYDGRTGWHRVKVKVASRAGKRRTYSGGNQSCILSRIARACAALDTSNLLRCKKVPSRFW